MIRFSRSIFLVGARLSCSAGEDGEVELLLLLASLSIDSVCLLAD
jgi:hypothetical protein